VTREAAQCRLSWARRVALPVLLLAVLALPATAEAWSSRANVSPVGQNAIDPQVAVDANGNAVFAWTRRDAAFRGFRYRVQTRTRTRVGSEWILSPIRSFPESTRAPNLDIAVDPDGDAVLTWESFDGTGCGGSPGCSRIQAAFRPSAGEFSGPSAISPAGKNAVSPQVAIDGRARAVFTWVLNDGSDPTIFGGCCWRVQARAIQPGINVGRPDQELSPAGMNASEPQVAVDANGNAVFAWRIFRSAGGECCWQVHTNAWPRNGSSSAPEPLSVFFGNAGEPQVAVASTTGGAAFVWRRLTFPSTCCWQVQFLDRTISPERRSSISPGGQNAFEPRVAVSGFGNGSVFAWRRFDGSSSTCCWRVEANFGYLGARIPLSGAGRNARRPDVSIHGYSDSGAVVWERFDGSSSACCWRIQASRVEPPLGSSYSLPPATLSVSGRDAHSPKIAFSKFGERLSPRIGHVVWQRFDGSSANCCERVQAMIGP
jgi:hypothetical protein